MNKPSQRDIFGGTVWHSPKRFLCAGFQMGTFAETMLLPAKSSTDKKYADLL
jgi:hypothetical protein